MTEEKQNSEELEFSNFKGDYPGIRDVSPFERLTEWLYLYYARIQTDTSPKFFLSIVSAVFVLIQSIFPAFLQQAVAQKDTSFIAKIMQIISVIWIGGGCFGSNGPYITSIIASSITIILIISICIRARVYASYKSMKPIEINIMFAISSYIFPILTSFTTNCVGSTIYNFVKGNVEAVQVVGFILAIIAFFVQVYMQYNFISPRVMFLHDVMLMWTPGSAALVTFALGINSALFTATIQSDKISSTVELAVIFIISYVIGIYLFLDSMFLNKIYGNIFCSMLISNGSSSILNIVALYTKIDYNILFFIIIIFVILSYLILHSCIRNFHKFLWSDLILHHKMSISMVVVTI